MHRHTLPLSTSSPRGATLGDRGEHLAAAHLARDDGMTVVARNWRLGSGAVRGELDIVAVDPCGDLVVVVEVKTRTSRRHGGPLVAVTPDKQARIRRLAAAWLRDTGTHHGRVRFDVIGVLLPRDGHALLDHVPGAF